MSLFNILTKNNLNLYSNSILLGNGEAIRQFNSFRFSLNITGPFNSLVYILVSQLNNMCVISIYGIMGTSTSSVPFIFSTNLIPIPPTNYYFPIWVTDNGSQVLGTALLDTNGTITIYKNFNTPFTGSGICGFEGFSMPYNVAE